MLDPESGHVSRLGNTGLVNLCNDVFTPKHSGNYAGWARIAHGQWRGVLGTDIDIGRAEQS